MTLTKIISTASAVLLAIIGLVVFWTSVYRVDATEVAVFQAFGTGTLTTEAVPGTYLRWGAKVTDYKKQDNYPFEYAKLANDDRSILVQFNDGGRAQVGGNVQWEMPQDRDHILALHVLYGSQTAVDSALMRNAINRAMTFTAPLMSATDSYAARRPEFLSYFADQLLNGIYDVITTNTVAADPITGDMKQTKVVSIRKDKDGNPIRAEESPLKKYGITIQAPTITHIVYEPKVEEQIQQQRDNILAIQTAQAQAKKAEQQAITAEKNGEAQAMQAKWEQEVIKAKAVTEASQQAEVAKITADKEKAVAETAAMRDKIVAETAAQRDFAVAQLAAKTAEQYKTEQTLRGQGEAAYKAALIGADGGFVQKVDAWVKSQQFWANAVATSKTSLVPQIQTGGGSGGQQNAALDFMSLMATKAAKDLSLDMNIRSGATK